MSLLSEEDDLCGSVWEGRGELALLPARKGQAVVEIAGPISSHPPAATSVAACWRASAVPASMTPNRPFTTAAAALMAARAAISERSIRTPEMGKFSTARCVWAPQRAAAGTRTSPIESCSILCSPPRDTSLMLGTVAPGTELGVSGEDPWVARRGQIVIGDASKTATDNAEKAMLFFRESATVPVVWTAFGEE